MNRRKQKAKSFQAIGQPIPRVDALDKLTGKALYAGDLSFLGMLHLKILRSSRPHANILGIQKEQAEAHPGVVAVLTHTDIPGRNRVGPVVKDQPVLCDRVRYIGDPVALIVAETLESAEEAINLIQVRYEDLPAFFSPEEALSPDSIRIHDAGNVLLERTLYRGDPDEALKRADVVITNRYRTQMVEHGYLEPEAGIADCKNSRITVWMPSKYAHLDHREIAEVLGLPVERVRVILTMIGGSFGDKQCLSPGFYAALASYKTGRPCKMVYDREESFRASTKRHPFDIEYTTGATNDGRIVAVKAEIVADTGAYCSYGPAILIRAMVHATGPYEVPNLCVKAKAVYTNNPIGGAMRGFGVPQVALAHESQMDILAERLRIDPFEIRLKNGLKSGALTCTGQYLGPSVGFTETIEKVREEIAKRGSPPSSGSKRYAWGIASMYYGIGMTGLPNPAFSRIEADDSGEFVLYLGCGDVGQGSATAMVQIAAEVLHARTEWIRLVAGDTDHCPDSGVSAASRVTYIVGRSVQRAAENLRDLLQEFAASMIEISTKEDLILDQGFFFPPGAPHRKVSVREVVRSLKRKGIDPAGEGKFDPETTALDPKTGQGSPYATYAFATQGALVSVDLDSGEVGVLDVVACHDVGRAVNPMNVVGQIEGGISMGLGYGLLEEIILKDGEILNPRLSEYFIPTALDLPQIDSFLIEAGEPTGPFGAKGVGEPALIPTAPAILNGVSACTGIHVKELPLTSEKLWNLLTIKGEPGK